MGFDEIIRNTAVPLADRLTADLQDEVQIYPWNGTGTYGEPTYGTVNPQGAIIEEKQYSRTLPSGDIIVQKASVTIPRPIAGLAVTERRNPIDPRDKIILPSGFTGPILHVDGVIDPKTHAPYMVEIILG